MTDKKVRRTKRKQRRSFLPWIDKLAVAFYWIVKAIVLLLDWWLAR